MIWQTQFECMERKELQRLQLERLQSVVRRVYNLVPFYRKRFEEAGVKPGDIRHLEDISKLPFTVKNDLRDNYPYGMFAVPLKEIVRIHSS
jgi:phenylacetate-CoA ligase